MMISMTESDVALLSDAALLALCESSMDCADQEELSLLLEKQRERQIEAKERSRLDHVLNVNRRGLLLKACARKEAVARGLRLRLDEQAK